MTTQRKDEMPEEIWCTEKIHYAFRCKPADPTATKYTRAAGTSSAEVMALRENIQAWRDHLSGYQAITTDVNLGIAVDVVITGMNEILSQPHTGGK